MPGRIRSAQGLGGGVQGIPFSAIAVALTASFLAPIGAQAQQPAVQRGESFAQTHCARCHAIGGAGDSPLPNAPPFRMLHQRYPIESLEEAFAEGIRTGHRAMPEFVLAREQIGDLIAYLRWLGH